jgi:hypothetical protein
VPRHALAHGGDRLAEGHVATVAHRAAHLILFFTPITAEA